MSQFQEAVEAMMETQGCGRPYAHHAETCFDCARIMLLAALPKLMQPTEAAMTEARAMLYPVICEDANEVAAPILRAQLAALQEEANR